MEYEALYYREPSFLYPLQSHPNCWFHVGKSDISQFIVGLVGDGKIISIEFDTLGDLFDLKRIDLPRQIKDKFDLPFNIFGLNKKIALIKNYIDESFRKRLELRDEHIFVKRFFLYDLNIGIEDIGDILKDYILDPEQFDNPEERTELEECIEGWKKEGSFIFWWGQNYYVDMTGKITTS